MDFLFVHEREVLAGTFLEVPKMVKMPTSWNYNCQLLLRFVRKKRYGVKELHSIRGHISRAWTSSLTVTRAK